MQTEESIANLSDAGEAREQRPQWLHAHAVILGLAVVAIIIIIVRACIQNITIDEALSYLWFASRESAFTQWFPDTANHVLNSVLMRLVTSIFGINELAVRTPALIGGVIYIISSACLAIRLTERKILQWTLFVCLVFNPFILDYLVAARGYALAAGFLLCSLALIANAMLSNYGAGERRTRRTSIWVSVLVGLSFSANISFGIADAVVALLFFVWLVLRSEKMDISKYARLAAECFGPGILTAFVICGWLLLNFPKGRLYFGSNSLWEMWRGLGNASFDALNPDLVNPFLMRVLRPLQRVALPWLAIFTLVLLLGANETARRRLKLGTDGLLSFVRFLIAAGATTVFLHWVAFRAVHLLLPKDRTALFFVPIGTLIFGAALAWRFRGRRTDYIRTWGLIVFATVAITFLGSLRLGYFKEWIFDADTKQLYWLANDLHNRCGISDFAVDWRYGVSMNFYREAYDNFSIPEFSVLRSDQLPADKHAYVIFLPTSEDFVREQKLKITYHDDQSGSAVAIRGCPLETPRK